MKALFFVKIHQWKTTWNTSIVKVYLTSSGQHIPEEPWGFGLLLGDSKEDLGKWGPFVDWVLSENRSHLGTEYLSNFYLRGRRIKAMLELSSVKKHILDEGVI